MRSTRPLWQLEERVRNHLKLVSNTILAIMRPGCLILTATILRSSIKASRRQQGTSKSHSTVRHGPCTHRVHIYTTGNPELPQMCTTGHSANYCAAWAQVKLFCLGNSSS